MKTTTLTLTGDERTVLGLAVECYVRLGLGQVSEIARRFDLLHGTRLNPEKVEQVRRLCDEMEDVLWDGEDPWMLEDGQTSLYTLTAFLLDARLNGNKNGERWVKWRIKTHGTGETVDPREP